MTEEKKEAQASGQDSAAAKPAPKQEAQAAKPQETQPAKRPEAQAEKPQEAPRKPVASPPPPLWPLGVAAIFAAFFVALVLWIIFRPRPDVWTDDAYVTAHIALIAPRVSGQVTTVEVDDNQQVKVGQTSRHPRSARL